MEEKNATLNAIISFFIPGVGQLLNGQMPKGVIFLFIAIFIYYFTWQYYLGLIWAIFCAYDAYKCAIMVNEGEEPPFLPF